MALTVDWPNALISVPQADLTLVSGTIYRMNTETYFRTQLMALMDDEQGMAWPTPFTHNTEVTVAGVTYARIIDVAAIPVVGTTADGPAGFASRFQVQFTPDSQWTVILEGSNNNIFDVENGILVQNQVQVIPTNSAGLQTVASGSGLSAAQATWLEEIYKRLDLDAADPNTYANDGTSITGNDFTLTKTDNGNDTSTVQRS